MIVTSNMNKYVLALMFAVIVSISFFVVTGKKEIVNTPISSNTVIAFGDSLIKGVGSDNTGGFVSLVSQELDIPIINAGHSGDTTAMGLQRLEIDVLSQQPGVVILLLGGNDFLHKVPKEDTFNNLREIIFSIQETGAMVVLLGVQGGILTDGYKSEYKSLAEKTGSLYVENVLKGIIGDSRLMDDSIHPNQKGYAIIAHRVAEVLAPYLLKNNSV